MQIAWRRHRRFAHQHRRPSRIRPSAELGNLTDCSPRMAHALLARGLRALLRAHQAAVHPWAASPPSAAAAGVSPAARSGGAGVSAAFCQAAAASGGQLPAPQHACRLHTVAAAVAAHPGGLRGCLPAADKATHGLQGQESQRCRSFRTTSGEREHRRMVCAGAACGQDPVPHMLPLQTLCSVEHLVQLRAQHSGAEQLLKRSRTGN